jgi:uncharacterized protein (DUF983 family)
MAQDEPEVQTSVLAAGLKGRCPRCGEGALFKGGLTLRDKCERCGLDYGFADSGDGPAVFAIFILGFLVLGAALLVEFRLEPPIWVHLVAWGLLTPLTGFLLLRLLKAMLIAQQYKH